MSFKKRGASFQNLSSLIEDSNSPSTTTSVTVSVLLIDISMIFIVKAFVLYGHLIIVVFLYLSVIFIKLSPKVLTSNLVTSCQFKIKQYRLKCLQLGILSYSSPCTLPIGISRGFRNESELT